MIVEGRDGVDGGADARGGRGTDRSTVRDALEDIGIDPADIDSVAELRDRVGVEIRARGEAVDDEVDLADVLDAPVDVVAPGPDTADARTWSTDAGGMVRQSTTDYPPDWDRRRRRVYERDDYRCQNCRRRGGPYGSVELHAHHVVPKSRGGVHRLDNLTTLCESCHDAVHSRAAVAPTALTEAEATPSPAAKAVAAVASIRTSIRQWKRMYRKVSRLMP